MMDHYHLYEKRREYAARRSERKARAKAQGTHTDIEWKALVAVCEFACQRCGERTYLTRDHIVPLYQGGCDCIANIQPLCFRCNAGKGSETIDLRPRHWSERVIAMIENLPLWVRR